MLKRIFKKKIKTPNEQVINIAKKFCSLEIPFKDFWEEYLVNEEIRKELQKHEDDLFVERGFYIDNTNIRNIDVTSYDMQYQIYFMMLKYLQINNILLPDLLSDPEITLIRDLLPDWLFDIDDSFLESVIRRCDQSKDEHARSDIYKKIIFNDFKYIDYPPEWINSGEWPIKDGRPYTFISQSKRLPEGVESFFIKEVLYSFRDEDTGEIIHIRQKL